MNYGRTGPLSQGPTSYHSKKTKECVFVDQHALNPTAQSKESNEVDEDPKMSQHASSPIMHGKRTIWKLKKVGALRHMCI